MAEPAPPSRRGGPRALVAPLVGYFDHRFDDVHQRLDRIETALGRLGEELATLRRNVELDAETTIELHHGVARAVDALAAELRAGTSSRE